MPTVLHILAPAPAGGLESVVQMLLPGLRRKGVAAEAAAVLDGERPEPPVVAALRAEQVPVTILRTAGRAYLAQWRAYREWVDRLKPDVVHTHGYLTDVIAGLAVRGRAARVSTTHGFTGGGWKNRLYERLQTRVVRSFDTVIAVSETVDARLAREGVPTSRRLLLPNAWGGRTAPLDRTTARAELKLAEGVPIIGWIGRLSREKGADVLLDAVARLTAPAQVVMVGSGPEVEALKQQARALGITDRLTWLGMVPEAGRLMPAFDLFVLSSRTEGTPIVLFEAMTARVPIVATRVGGVPNVLQGDTARLVDPEHPAALAAAIQEVLADSPAARRRAEAAQHRLNEHYALDPWIERHVHLYQELSRKGRTR